VLTYSFEYISLSVSFSALLGVELHVCLCVSVCESMREQSGAGRGIRGRTEVAAGRRSGKGMEQQGKNAINTEEFRGREHTARRGRSRDRSERMEWKEEAGAGEGDEDEEEKKSCDCLEAQTESLAFFRFREQEIKIHSFNHTSSTRRSSLFFLISPHLSAVRPPLG